MHENTMFYYGDDAGNPVGPLSLEEIRKFADAKVLPRSVMICEAGGENWISLETFAEAEPIGKSISPKLPLFVEVTDPSRKIQHLKITYTVAILISLAACGLSAVSNRAAVDNGSYFDPNSARENFVILLWIVSLGSQAALIYQLIRALPNHLQFTTPLKASGFFLIPFFSIYWIFRLFPEIAKSIQKWSQETVPVVPKRVAWLGTFAIIAASLMAVGKIYDLYSILAVSEYSDMRTLKRDFILWDLTGAVGLAAFFHFTLSILHIVRGLLYPEDYDQESRDTEQRGFWTLRRKQWNPSWAYLFIFVAIIPWR